MTISLTRSAVMVLLGAAGTLWVSGTAAAQEHRNLQVLPSDISRSDLTDIMLDNLRGLGLPRLAGEGCLFCHEGNLETPRREWDYASDAKPMKQKARVMLAMMRAINEQHLPQLQNRIDQTSRVTCMTCHAGRTDPRPLPVVLWEAYEAGGADRLDARYRALRQQYYASDAYDFRIGVLSDLAFRMADGGAIDDAIAVAALNAEVNPGEPVARQTWVELLLERTVDGAGVPAALRELEAMDGQLPPGVLSPDLLNNLAWRLRQSNREPQGNALIEANYERFPDEYIPLESLAFIRAGAGQTERAVEILEGWLVKYPDHARARQLLLNLRR